MLKKRTKISVAITLTSILFLIFFAFPTVTHAEALYMILSKDSGLGNTVRSIWQQTLNAINLFVIAILIAVAFSQILRINVNTYGVKKVLPSILLATVAANFSMLICRIFVDISNVTMTFFLAGSSSTIQSNQDSVTGAFTSVTNGLNIQTASETNSGLFWFTIAQILVIVGAVLVLILAFLFIVRNWLIYFLIPLAPLAFMCTILPQSKAIFTQWWSNFTKWVFMPVVSCFWLWLGGLWFKEASTSTSVILTFGFAAVCYYMAITTPFKMGGSIMGAWGNLGKKAWGATGGKATAWAGREMKERTVDAGLKAKDAIRNKVPFIKNVDDKIAQQRKKLIRNKQERLLRAEGPKLLNEKLEKDARIDAADKLANDPNTNKDVASRYRALQRAWVLEEAKSSQYTNASLHDLTTEVKLNPDGTLVTPDNDPLGQLKGPYTGKDGFGHQMAITIELARRARNARDPREKLAAENFVNAHMAKKADGSLVPMYKLDAHGYASSPVGAPTDPAAVEVVTKTAGQANGAQLTREAQFGNTPLENLPAGSAIHVIVAGYTPEAGTALMANMQAIRQKRDSMVEEEYSMRSKGVDEHIDGIKMVMDSQANGLRLGTIKGQFEKAQAMMAEGNLEGAKSVIGGISGGLGTFANEDDMKKAIEARMERIQNGIQHFDQLNNRVASVTNPTERQAEFQKIRDEMHSDTKGYLEGIRKDMLEQARIDSHASVAAQNVMGNVMIKNPEATVAHLASPEGIDELTHAIEGLQGTINSQGTSGISGINQATRIDPMGVGAKTIITDALNSAIRDGMVAATTKLSDAMGNKAFQNNIAEGMKRAIQENTVTTKTKK